MNKRWVFGAAIVILAVGQSCAAEVEPKQSEAAPAVFPSGAPAEAPTEASVASGTTRGYRYETFEVGDLTLKITGLEAHDADGKRFIGVGFRATNARGDDYLLRAGYFRLVDEQRVIHDAITYDSSINPNVPFDQIGLARGGQVEGWVIFRVPLGTEASEVWYEPLMSRNRAEIIVRGVGR